MGIRIHRNTWSAPLQLIDCWLPPARTAAVKPLLLSRVASRFIQAGWLQRPASNDASAQTVPMQKSAAIPVRPVVTRMLRVASHVHSASPADCRVRLSGRLSDVCAELERLSAREVSQGGHVG